MRLREFFERLPRDGWQFMSEDTPIIRNYSRGKCECPITAAGTVPRSDSSVIVTARELGLSRRMTQRIIDAADCYSDMTPTIRRIRRLLLRHCNLTE